MQVGNHRQDQQITSLVRQVRVLQFVVVALSVGLALTWMIQATPSVSAMPEVPTKEKQVTYDKVTCERLTAKIISVVDDNGKTRIRISLTEKEHVPFISIYEPDGRPRMELSASPASTAMMMVHPEGNQAQIGVNKANAGIALGRTIKGSPTYGVKLVDSKSGALIGLKAHDDKEGDDRILLGIIDGKYDVRIRR